MIKPFCIGIIGGMGPRAGVELQRLIIERTRVSRDQDHIPVICISDPRIPDRTESLRRDGGIGFVRAVSRIGERLVAAGATVIVIPCNTAHVRLREIRETIPVPVLDMVELTIRSIAEQFPRARTLGVLSTRGTREWRLYERYGESHNIQIIHPPRSSQPELMRLIYAVKRGRDYRCLAPQLQKFCRELMVSGAEVVVLGCTELSLLSDALGDPRRFIDPLHVTAEYLVRRSGVSMR